MVPIALPGLYYYESPFVDPAFNLAIEEFLMLDGNEGRNIVLLWQNEPTVVVGRHQNTFEEINETFIERCRVHVVRRNSGGGAVYHDLGNLNYSFLVPDGPSGFDFSRFTGPVVKTLEKLGVRAENGGRNDIVVDGLKISGGAQFKCQGRLLHHGTILFDSRLDDLAEALRTPKKYASSARPSVRSRVANIREFLVDGPHRDLAVDDFKRLLLEEIQNEQIVQKIAPTRTEFETVEKLRNEKYRNWNWNFGRSPSFWTHGGSRKFDWGYLDIRLLITGGTVRDAMIYGDFFSEKDPAELIGKLTGLRFLRNEISKSVSEKQIAEVLPALSKEEFLDLLFPSETV